MNYFYGVSELRFCTCLPKLPLPPTPMLLTVPAGFCTDDDDYATKLAALFGFWLLFLAPYTADCDVAAPPAGTFASFIGVL